MIYIAFFYILCYNEIRTFIKRAIGRTMFMKIFSKDDYINNNIISSSVKTVNDDIYAHGHNFFELEFIVDGTGIYEIDGVEYEIKKNTLFLMTPANVHSLKNTSATLINVMFSHEHNEEILSSVLDLSDSPHFTFDTTDGILLNSLLHELVKANEENNTSYAMLLINCVMSKLYYSKKSSETSTPSYISQAVIYMFENFQTDIDICDIADHLGLSAAYFSDLFKKQTCTSPKDYLDDIRFSYAEKLLTLTKLSVKEVHFKSGFRDYTNFVRRFKQRYSMTPTEYRKLYT